MDINTLLYIALALIVALGFAFFQYLYKKNDKIKKDYIFFTLRTLALFLVLLILINPKITSTEFEINKPELVVLADNSQSISYLEEEESFRNISEFLAGNEKIQENFEVSQLYFGEKLELKDSLDFSANQTDIFSALSETEKIFSSNQSAIVLLTDGNQSLGRDFRYFKKKAGSYIFPLIIGDTTSYKDLSVERINVNKYAFLNNKFPVEVFLNYSGEENVNADFSIKSGQTIVYSEKLNFSNGSNSEIIRTELPANSLGVKTYQVEIEPISAEKNKVNNTRKLAIEVIDERTSVLILSDITHPDLGTLQKAIESNQQRTADIKYIDDKNLQILDYQLIILYQVNRKFNDVVAEILEENYNYLMITGAKTDWNYLNNLDLGYSRSATSQSQEIFPVYNPTFSSFQFENIGFDDYPPLLDKFGPLEFDQNKFNVMLSQELQGLITGEPLMGVTQSVPKSGFLFGENIWRWRAKSYLDHKSFKEFDDFIGKLVQNLASKTSRQRLTVDSENFYYANQNVIISAQYFDENYQFDAGANLKISINNKETDEKFSSDLILKNNFYQFDGGDLDTGQYTYTLSVQGSNLSKSGSFEVVAYNTEQQFVSSNLSGMQSFAENNEAKLYYPDELNDLVNTLLTDDKFKPIQKSRQKNVPLIDWYYLLFILITILAAEWFYRKYLGLI
ncbi:hypothetical protein [Christiangramia forsetii]|uniref:VWA domain-containing protein n=2 Tax=Christiangramia forsetii TaxID=411153 RepID=A0M291_CHRFK|nr:hypothetical protein [Christiangramia forsetii]GGG39775.1 hypothetical protein GCM10011532_24410 [Christiangramia forsetii]CAL66736.1 conserved hypothetical protein, membrane [Christiangramia forsetii KT0803]